MNSRTLVGFVTLLTLLRPLPGYAQSATPSTTTVPWKAIWESAILLTGEVALKRHEPARPRWCGPTVFDGGGIWSPDTRSTANALSWATMATALAIEAAQVSREPEDRTHRLVNAGRTIALTSAIAQVVKVAAARQRPDDSNAVSFFSEHTAIATAALVASIRHGGSRKALLVTVPLTAATAYFRVAAGKHWTSDVLAGAAAGALVGALTP